ncbi:hypothetical protein [Prauserella flavalba]|uniref:Uncharacterized protein n=1 Tax=Prauserella flavalba TaxID=1477506 RepID=A0A318LA07_9PSEU|nr:hypothetical protein [Prauserella flavalba]PXY17638.1 hypothetical protein BA062_37170 [Prauserella flavalba]PXY21596.1 hypothetical protein BA062_32340 [Prauserella flavalba]
MKGMLTVTGVLAAVVLGGPAPTATAQEAADPVLAHADVAITLDESGEDLVRATYRLTEPTTAPVSVRLLVAPRAGTEVTELTAVSGITGIGPVRGIRAAATLPEGTTEYTVEQRIQRTGEARGVPLAVPDLAADRGLRVAITVTLPEGQRLVGDSMPVFEQQHQEGDRVVLRHDSRSLPSMVVAEYGTTSSASLGTVTSYTGLVLIVAVVAVWLVTSLRKERPRA